MQQIHDRGLNQSMESALQCSLTLAIMEDPVIDASGHTFDRRAIEEALRRRPGVSPFTNQRYPNGNASLRTNYAMRGAVEAFRQHLQPQVPHQPMDLIFLPFGDSWFVDVWRARCDGWRDNCVKGTHNIDASVSTRVWETIALKSIPQVRYTPDSIPANPTAPFRTRWDSTIYHAMS